MKKFQYIYLKKNEKGRQNLLLLLMQIGLILFEFMRLFPFFMESRRWAEYWGGRTL